MNNTSKQVTFKSLNIIKSLLIGVSSALIILRLVRKLCNADLVFSTCLMSDLLA